MSAHHPFQNDEVDTLRGGTTNLTPNEIALAIEAYYPRFKGLVRTHMARLSGRNPDQFTETPTAHTNDLCMDMLRQRQPFRDAEHMMAVASIRCIQILVDYLRRRGRAKRGAGNRGIALNADIEDSRHDPDTWLMRDGIGEALTRFTEEYPRQARVLMLRAFMGRTTPEIAELTGVSTATVERDLHAARAYLQIHMRDWNEAADGPSTVRG